MIEDQADGLGRAGRPVAGVEEVAVTSALPIVRYVGRSPRICGMTYSPIIGMNTRMLPVTRPGSAIGSVTCRKRRPAAGPEVLGGLDQRAVHPLERHVEREDHQRQVAVDEPDEHGGLGAEDAERPVARSRPR